MYMAGIDPTEVSTIATHGLGEIVFSTTTAGTKGYIYIQSAAGITDDGYICNINGTTFTATLNSTASSAAGTGQGRMCGVARAAIPTSSYGWLQIYGNGTVRVLASCAAYTQLNTTATAGAADDDATAASRVVDGININIANGGSTANVVGFLNWPRVGRTL